MELYSGLMIFGGIVAVIGWLGAIINFARIFSTRKISGSNILLHLGLPFVAGCGSLAFIIGLVIYLLETYAK